jgi:hypothetical protein
VEAAALGHQLDQDRDSAVGLRRRPREETVRDLALHHHTPELDLREVVQALCDQRRSDVVREVRDELRRAGCSVREIELECVAEAELDVRPPGQALEQPRAE